MKTLIEKKVVMKPHLSSKSLISNDSNEKMMEKTTIIYLLGLPIFRSILNFKDSSISDSFCNGTSKALSELHP